MENYSDKYEYFPREKFFVETQELVSTFFSSGNYFNETIEPTDSFLSDSTYSENEFYNCLFLFSLISNSHKLLDMLNKIFKQLVFSRKKRTVYSDDLLKGEINIEKYIQLRKIEKEKNPFYPLIQRYSNYQLPEYQLTLYIIMKFSRLLEINCKKYSFLKDSYFYKDSLLVIRKLKYYSLSLQNKYGVSVKNNDSIHTLIDKVEFRYKNKIVTNRIFLELINLYRIIVCIKGIDFNSRSIIDYLKYTPEFDDRLYEIWLLKKLVYYFQKKYPSSKIDYLPLYKARIQKKPCVTITTNKYYFEIIYQNRTQLLNTSALKWYWLNEEKEEKIGAIPDIIIKVSSIDGSNFSKIVLLDAKNRSWELNKNMSQIKGEVVQQIYILDNFKKIFQEDYKSLLIAHNIMQWQNREFYSKENPNYRINVISLDLKDESLDYSLNNLFNIINNYLQLEN